MTTNDGKNVQILMNLKNGEKLIGLTDDKILINMIAGFVKFIQVDENKFDSIALKEVMK